MKRAVWLVPVIFSVNLGVGAGILLLGLQDLAIFAPVAIIGVAVFVLALFRPLWGYLLFSIALPLQSEEYALAQVGGSVIRLADGIALPVFVGWLFSACFVRKEGLPFRKTGLELPLLFFSFFVFLSAFWSISLTSSISKVLQLVYAVILFYMTVDLIKSRQYLTLVFWSWLIGGILLAGTTVYDSLTSAERASSVFGTTALATGEYLNYPLFLGIGLVLASINTRARIVTAGMTVICGMALFGTASRGPMLGCVCAMFFLAIVLAPVRKLLTFVPAAATIILSITVVWSVALDISLIELVQDSMVRFLALIENPASDIGVDFRLTLWQAAWKLILRNPILGIGVGSLSECIPRYTPVEFGHTEVLHNLYLEMLLLFGYLGFLFFLWLFVRMAKILWKIWQELEGPFFRALMVGVVAALIAQAAGWLTYGKFMENRVFWVCFSISIAIVRVYRNEIKTPAPFALNKTASPSHHKMGMTR